MIKKHHLLIPVLMLAVLLCCAAEIGAFQCDDKFISVGSFRDEVLSQCGSPSISDSWQEERFVDGYISDSGRFRTRRVLVTIDRWTYNQGPNRFMQVLTFENGRLTSVKSGRTGY